MLPAADHQERKGEPDNAAEFDELIGKATEVRTTPFAESNRDAHLSAGEHVLDSADVVFAVWDGQPGGGRGGTGNVVRAARDRGLPVTVVRPSGAEREQQASRPARHSTEPGRAN